MTLVFPRLSIHEAAQQTALKSHPFPISPLTIVRPRVPALIVNPRLHKYYKRITALLLALIQEHRSSP